MPPIPSPPPRWSMRPARSLRQAGFALMMSLLPAAPVLAEKPPNITAGEIALLPPYCPDTMGFSYGDAYFNTSPRAGYWIGLMGKSFWAVHHYCWALIKLRRSEMAGVARQVRIGTLYNVIGEYNYVLENSTPDFVLRPELFLRRGDAQLKLGDFGGALESYEAAIQFKPDYWPAYVNWAELQMSLKRNKEAQAFLERGLTQSPNELRLHAAYKKAGGDPDAFVRKLPQRRVAPPLVDVAASAAAPHPPAASDAR